MADQNGRTLAGDEESLRAPNEQAEENSESTTGDGQSEIPEKWKGKSIQDVIRAHEEAEKRMHEVATERSLLKRDAEEKAQRLYELQNAVYQQNLARQSQSEADPLANIEEEVSTDPVKAIQKVVSYVKDSSRKSSEEAQRMAREIQAREYYERSKKDNQDFAKREPEMAELAKRYQHLLRPDMLNSKEAIEVLDLMSRGSKVSDYVKEAEERVRKERESIKQEKRQAFSESSNSQVEGSDESSVNDFSKMSLEEQEKELRKMERKLGRSKQS